MSDIQLQLRRDDAVDLQSATPVEGEPGYDKTNKRLFVGDGQTSGGILIPNAEDILKGKLTRFTTSGTDTYAGTLDYFNNYAAGQRVEITFTNANTTSATININSKGAKNLKNSDGDNFSSGDIEAGSSKVFEYDGTEFNEFVSSGGGGAQYLETQVFTASGTWTMPNNCKYVEVIVTAGGGGGGSQAGSGAGGGTSSFGSHCSATGGEAGIGSSSGNNKPSQGGTATNGDINLNGGGGAGGLDNYSGLGGASYWGGGSTSIGTSTMKSPADAYGSGGAGSGTAVNNNNSQGGGGGAGGTSIKTIDASSLGGTEVVTVGVGGAGFNTVHKGSDGQSGIVVIKAYG